MNVTPSRIAARIRRLLPALAAVVAATSPAGEAPAAPEPVPRLAINLAGPADWNTELPLVDVFRFSRQWIGQQEGKPWGAGPALALDERGWVTRLEPGCRAETPVCTIDGDHYPAGTYTVLYDGKGSLDFWGAATVKTRAPGRMEIDVDPAKGGFFVRLGEVDPNDYVRNIRIVMPGFAGTFETEPWHPGFLARWRGFSCLRFMDFMHTNNSEIRTWEDRPRPDDATWTAKGVPLEQMCDLANRLDADPWFCMPHRADDDYVRRFAEQAKALLKPGLRVYVEYSNEVWNGMFAQSRYAGEKGIELGFAEKPWEGAWRYNAHRSVEIFAIWEDVFGGTDRLVRVLATQAANPYVSRQIVEFESAFEHADALAVAPYITMNVPADRAEATVALGLEGILDAVENTSLPQAIDWIRGQQAVAAERGLSLIAYEGGQHLVGVGGGENNTELEALFKAANRHARMGAVYTRYYDAWAEAGGDVFAVFSSVGRWSKWGSWGLMEYADESPADYPKYLATLRWAKAAGQDVTLPE